MIRILILNLAHGYGGASERCVSILKALPEGWGALASLEDSPVTKRARQLGLETHCVGIHKLDPRIAVNLDKLIQSENFQVLDSQNAQSRFWGNRVAARTGVPHIATLNSWPTKEYGKSLRGYVYNYLDRRQHTHTKAFVAVSSEIKKEFISAGYASSRITIVPNAVEVASIEDPGRRAWLSSAYKIPENASVCCGVGRLTEVKGFRFLIDSIARIKEKGGNLHCLILGEGAARKKLEEQIAQLELEDRVQLLGDQNHDNVLKIVNACDYFVMPSLSEGTPLALLEAAALGKPIVASSVGGIPELVTHDESSILVPPKDVDALDQALIWMCENPEDAGLLGERARSTVKRKFSMQQLLDALLPVYQKAMDGAVEKE